MLIAEGTRDEGAATASIRREAAMMKSIHAARRALIGGPINFDLMSSFSVSDDGATQGVLSFVEDEREAHKKQLSDVEDTPMEIKQGEAKETTRLEPSSYRPSWQSGLEDF